MNSTLSIKRAIIENIDSIMDIVSKCTQHMISNGIFQWNDAYPSRETFLKDIEDENLYVLLKKDKIIGCVSFCNKMDEFYEKVEWLSDSKNNVYVHRLAITPIEQGNGYSKILMNYIEKECKTKHVNSIRLDTFSINEKNNKLYEGLGYKKLGQIYFRKQSDYPFNCYEKLLR